jgi:hypothetical protein
MSPIAHAPNTPLQSAELMASQKKGLEVLGQLHANQQARQRQEDLLQTEQVCLTTRTQTFVQTCF